MGSNVTESIHVVLAFSALALITTTCRILARRETKSTLKLSDWINIIDTVVNFALCIAIERVSVNIDTNMLNQADISSKVSLYCLMTMFTIAAYLGQLQIIGQVVPTAVIGTSKISVLLFYKEIFDIWKFRAVANVLIAVSALWTIVFFFLELFIRDPTYKPGSGGQFAPLRWNDGSMWVSAASIDIALDAVIVTLPIPVLLGLHMELRRKILILGMFLLGALVTVASVARLYYIVKTYVDEGHSILAGSPEDYLGYSMVIHRDKCVHHWGKFTIARPALPPSLLSKTLVH
ncbi:hypothetical protein CHU98_g11197 [Xylaria longipes]|nr:hypothetical protein CHU98_g11197 [Xylaria longipes]